MKHPARVALLAVLALWTPLATAQTRGRAADLDAGRFLVARRTLLDPNFAQTVVLLVQYGKEGAMGLIVNRQTKVPLSRILDELPPQDVRSETVYAGGPVEKGAVLALIRSGAKIEDARPVFDDVYVVSTKKLLEKSMTAANPAGTLRVYLGYAGWGAGQLEREVKLGSWAIFQAEAGLVFDPDPDSVWTRLIRRTEMRIALRH